jgi:hypothetical protein
VTPPAPWTTDELARRPLLEQGVAMAVNLRRHHNLIAWAKQRGLFVRVDRATPWGNPFVLGKDGDRTTVIARYPRPPGVQARPAGAARRAAREGAGVLVRAAGVPCGSAPAVKVNDASRTK